MITPEYCRTMARYNLWQNNGLRRVVEAMRDADLRADRGAFFGSILDTLNHLLWADRIWMSRFARHAKPPGGIKDSVTLTPTVAVWGAERFRTDGAIRLWADSLKSIDLTGNLSWFSGALGRDVTKPRSLCIAHMFNHQTHHRGQIHAMLTAAGQTPADTDLFLLPESI